MNGRLKYWYASEEPEVFIFKSEPYSSPYTCLNHSLYRNAFYIGDYLRFKVNLSTTRQRRYFVAYPANDSNAVHNGNFLKCMINFVKSWTFREAVTRENIQFFRPLMLSDLAVVQPMLSRSAIHDNVQPISIFLNNINTSLFIKRFEKSHNWKWLVKGRIWHQSFQLMGQEYS